jgi:glycosyltransferase involved in cell wall biosynthesis
MKKLRVSFDVSFAAGSAGRPRVVTGVGRVITELFQRLVQFPDLDVKAVGCFGNDWNPVSTSLLAERWAADTVSGDSVSMSSYRSITGLSRSLAEWQVRLESSRENGCKLSVKGIGLRALRRLLRFDARLKIDSSNTDIFFLSFKPAPSGLSSSVPRLVYIYDLYPLRFPESCGPAVVGNLQSILDDLDAKRDVVVSISEFTKQDFCEATGFPEDRVVVSPLAADEKFQPSNNPGSIERCRIRYQLDERPYLLSVANPQPRKNLVTAIRAFAQAAHEMPQWDGTLVLAGNPDAGWRTEMVDDVIREYSSIAGRVLRTGAVDDADLPTLYSGATAFLFPSTFEGFGLPVLEAMQCGTPVICSNTTSLPEVVDDAAITCDPLDVGQFAESIKRLVSSPSDRERYAKAGFARSKKFSWRRTAECVHTSIRLAGVSIC